MALLPSYICKCQQRFDLFVIKFTTDQYSHSCRDNTVGGVTILKETLTEIQ